MIEIAFWGQNQASFCKAAEIIKRIYNITISSNTVLKITEFIGKIVYDYNNNNALEIWNNRANLEVNTSNKKGTLYIQADGATWLRNMISELFPEAIQILDKFHLIENIYQYGKFIFNDDINKTEKLKDKIIGYCYSGEYNLIVKKLNKYQNINIPKTICNLPIYLENNKNKIDYSSYEHKGWFIGSGAIESSNKTVVQLRLKQAGMRWSVDGSNYLITLRCMYESGNWNKIEKIVVNSLYH